ncbi:MAG: hypothetical protein U0031_03355 [Thermomicrobiales bacterium]
MTRRTIVLRGLASLGIGFPPLATAVDTSLDVRVAPPMVTRGPGCDATVRVSLTIAGIALGRSIEVSADLIETDAPDDDPDPCFVFPARIVRILEQHPYAVSLTCTAMAAAMGLVKGVGPAADEIYSPDLVELVARVWLRDVVTGEAFGPWLSPTRVAISSGALAWTPDDQQRGQTLLEPPPSWPRSRDGASRHLPPQACLP